MKKIILLLLFLALYPLLPGRAEAPLGAPANTAIAASGDTAVLTWDNPADISFAATVLFRSTIPIADYFSYEAVAGLCDKIYEGEEETFTDTGLAANLPYYYIFFSRDHAGSTSEAVILEKLPKTREPKPSDGSGRTGTLAGATAALVNEVSFNEAGIVYDYNQAVDTGDNADSRRLALFIIVKSPHDLTERDRNAISYFIHEGTPTTILLGTGERAGVLNSYLSVFEKLPRNQLEWQDVIKIANGRWPNERSPESEERAADEFFSTIYERSPDMNNPRDNAAVTVIAYGLRPAARNLASEQRAIDIFRAIFDRSPSEATDWDMVRAIAYSGATR